MAKKTAKKTAKKFTGPGFMYVGEDESKTIYGIKFNQGEAVAVSGDDITARLERNSDFEATD